MKFQISVLSIATIVALTSAPVMAADMRLPPPPAPPPPPLAYTWTGFYLGAHMGSAWTNSEWTTFGVPGTDASIGAAGFIYRKNIITVFMCIELMLNAVNLSFVAFSYKLNQVDGHIFSFFVMVVAAAEAAVGLAIILTVFKNRQTLEVDDINSLKN